MFGRRGLGIIWLLLTLVVVAGVGIFAYQAGLAVNLSHAPAAAGGAAVPAYAYYGPWAWGWGFGFGAFHLIGILFFVLLLLFLLRFAFRPRGWGGWAGYRQGPWQGQGGPSQHFQERFEEMHRRAHGEARTPPPAETPDRA
jgi:hypothetical protein